MDLRSCHFQRRTVLCLLLFLCAVAGVLQTTGALEENTFIKIVAINLSLAS